MLSSSGKKISELRSLKEIQKMLPGNLAYSTIHRWRISGLIGPNGDKVRLPMRKIGGKFFIDEQELWTWLDLVGQNHAEQKVHPQRDHADLDRCLDAEHL